MKHFIFFICLLFLLNSCKSKLQCYECELVGSQCATCNVVKPTGEVIDYANKCFTADAIASGDMAFWISQYETNEFLTSQGTINCFTYDTKQYVFKVCLTKDEREEELAIYEEEEGYTCKPIDPYYK